MRAASRLTFAGLATLALAALGCGRVPEVHHLDEVRELCLGLASGPAGAAQGASDAEALFGPPSFTECATDLPPASSADACPRDGSSVCVRVWAWRAHSTSLCGGAACSYGCELRAPEGAPEATCSVRFLDGSELPAGQ